MSEESDPNIVIAELLERLRIAGRRIEYLESNLSAYTSTVDQTVTVIPMSVIDRLSSLVGRRPSDPVAVLEWVIDRLERLNE